MAILETKTFQLPMGIEREDKCIGEGLQASKSFKASFINMLVLGGFPRLLVGTIFSGTIGCYGRRWGGHT